MNAVNGKWNKRIIAAAVGLVVLCFCLFWTGRNSDFFEEKLLFSDFYHFEEENADTPLLYLGLYNWASRETGDANTVSFYRDFKFEKGTYQFTVKPMPTATENEYFFLCDAFRPGPENQPRLIYAKYALTPGEPLSFSVTFEQASPNVIMAFSSPEGALSVSSVEVASVGPVYSDSLFIALGLLVAGMFLLWRLARYREQVPTLQNGKDTLSQNTVLLVCLSAAIVASLPMMQTFLYWGHDLLFHLTRIEGISLGLQNGQFPVRLNQVHGYERGYAGGILYPDLFLYIPAFLRAAGLSALLAYQTFILLINLATAWISYQCFSRLTRSATAGVFGCVLYTLALYRLVNLYSRAALGEALAMIFLPAVALGLYQWLYEKENKVGWLIFGAFGLMNSHVISVLLVALVCFCVLLYNWRLVFQPKRLVWGGAAAALIFLVCAWNWVPLLSFARLELQILDGAAGDLCMAISPVQLFSTLGISTLPDPTMTRGLGLLFLFGLLLWVWGRYLQKDAFPADGKRLESIGFAGAVTAFCCVFISSTLMPWPLLVRIPVLGSILSKLQFPYRFMSPGTLAASIATALAVYRYVTTPKRERWAVLAVLIAAILCISPFYGFLIASDYHTLENKHTQLNINEPPDWLYYWRGQDNLAFSQRDASLSTPNDLIFSNYQKAGSSLSFDYQNPNGEQSLVETPLYYYPGYTATDGAGNLLTVAKSQYNYVVVEVPAGTSGQIAVSYTGLWYFKVGNLITLITLAGLSGYGIYRFTKRRRPAA